MPNTKFRIRTHAFAYLGLATLFLIAVTMTLLVVRAI